MGLARECRETTIGRRLAGKADLFQGFKTDRASDVICVQLPGLSRYRLQRLTQWHRPDLVVRSRQRSGIQPSLRGDARLATLIAGMLEHIVQCITDGG